MTNKIKDDVYDIINEYKGKKIKGDLLNELESKLVAYARHHFDKKRESFNESQIQNIECDQDGFTIEFTIPTELIESDQK